MENTKKAFGYLRVSGKSQVDGDGFPRQKAAIQKWAKANGFHIVQWFVEEGVSGHAGKPRSLGRHVGRLDEQRRRYGDRRSFAPVFS